MQDRAFLSHVREQHRIRRQRRIHPASLVAAAAICTTALGGSVEEDFSSGDGLTSAYTIFAGTAIEGALTSAGTIWVGPVEGITDVVGNPFYNDVAMLPNGTGVLAFGPSDLHAQFEVEFAAPVESLTLTIHDVESAGSLHFLGLDARGAVIYDSGPVGDPVDAAGFDLTIDPQAPLWDLIVTVANDGVMFSRFVGTEFICPADIDGNGVVSVKDLLSLLAAWGPCDAPCTADLDESGAVDVNDLLELLAAWGDC